MNRQDSRSCVCWTAHAKKKLKGEEECEAGSSQESPLLNYRGPATSAAVDSSLFRMDQALHRPRPSVFWVCAPDQIVRSLRAVDAMDENSLMSARPLHTQMLIAILDLIEGKIPPTINLRPGPMTSRNSPSASNRPTTSTLLLFPSATVC
jgi:hypothetical protein